LRIRRTSTATSRQKQLHPHSIAAALWPNHEKGS
jgi:hypothetical protein